MRVLNREIGIIISKDFYTPVSVIKECYYNGPKGLLTSDYVKDCRVKGYHVSCGWAHMITNNLIKEKWRTRSELKGRELA